MKTRVCLTLLLVAVLCASLIVSTERAEPQTPSTECAQPQTLSVGDLDSIYGGSWWFWCNSCVPQAENTCDTPAYETVCVKEIATGACLYEGRVCAQQDDCAIVARLCEYEGFYNPCEWHWVNCGTGLTVGSKNCQTQGVYPLNTCVCIDLGQRIGCPGSTGWCGGPPMPPP